VDSGRRLAALRRPEMDAFLGTVDRRHGGEEGGQRGRRVGPAELLDDEVFDDFKFIFLLYFFKFFLFIFYIFLLYYFLFIFLIC
jgi:hypothetical protein